MVGSYTLTKESESAHPTRLGWQRVSFGVDIHPQLNSSVSLTSLVRQLCRVLAPHWVHPTGIRKCLVKYYVDSITVTFLWFAIKPTHARSINANSIYYAAQHSSGRI